MNSYYVINYKINTYLWTFECDVKHYMHCMCHLMYVASLLVLAVQDRGAVQATDYVFIIPRFSNRQFPINGISYLHSKNMLMNLAVSE